MTEASALRTEYIIRKGLILNDIHVPDWATLPSKKARLRRLRIMIWEPVSGVQGLWQENFLSHMQARIGCHLFSSPFFMGSGAARAVARSDGGVTYRRK
ncbi:MAG TPA: hypothetical protein VG839_08100 [Asticcacaulis sp.]|nr:hypothetical protein [Asticcacaulis sp.]